ncbi:MAG: GNAT family N-acetyltransferase [Acidimicrobiia bacterium]|nr:GNAT family N-acetyltransferase [Acidimicrobiia bacterium]
MTACVVKFEDGITRHKQHAAHGSAGALRLRARHVPIGRVTWVFIMSEETLRWRGGWARLGPWRGNDEIAYLSVGASRPAPQEVVDRCLGALREHGFSSVVTNALAPGDALPFVDAGFVVREQLHLLSHDLRDLPATERRTRRARKTDRAPVLAIDKLAFAPFWQLDARGLTNAIGATPSSRFRITPRDSDGGKITAYGITGRAGMHGYLQRVAVHPDVKRQGLGTAVVADGLAWLKRHGVSRCLVNTQSDNSSALALYRACGFSEQPVGLCVMGRSL